MANIACCCIAKVGTLEVLQNLWMYQDVADATAQLDSAAIAAACDAFGVSATGYARVFLTEAGEPEAALDLVDEAYIASTILPDFVAGGSVLVNTVAYTALAPPAFAPIDIGDAYAAQNDQGLTVGMVKAVAELIGIHKDEVRDRAIVLSVDSIASERQYSVKVVYRSSDTKVLRKLYISSDRIQDDAALIVRAAAEFNIATTGLAVYEIDDFMPMTTVTATYMPNLDKANTTWDFGLGPAYSFFDPWDGLVDQRVANDRMFRALLLLVAAYKDGGAVSEATAKAALSVHLKSTYP